MHILAGHRNERNPTFFFLVLPKTRERVCVPGKRHLGINQPKSLFPRKLDPSHEVSVHHGAVRAEVGDVHDGVDQEKHDSKRVVALTCWMGLFP